jgi:putative cell wall-binding protein
MRFTARRACSLAAIAALLLALVPATALAAAAPVAPKGLAPAGIATAPADQYEDDDSPDTARDMTALLGGYNGSHGWGKALLEETHTFDVARGSADGFESDSDWYRMDVDGVAVSAGLSYLLEAQSVAPGVHPVIEVYGPTATDTVQPSNVASLPLETDIGESPTAVAASSGSPWSLGTDQLTTLDFSPDSVGTYFFRVRPYLGQADASGVPSPIDGSDGAGTYTLRMKIGQLARIAGSNRVMTAVLASRELYPDGALAGGSVVIASSVKYADALAGTVLAGACRSPLLLTGPNGLDDAVADEIERLGATHAYVLGGPTTLVPQVETDLQDTLGGADTTTRIAGGTRVQTASMIAEAAKARLEVKSLATAQPRNIPDRTIAKLAFVVNGWGYADALSASPMATRDLAPILLTPSFSSNAPLDSSVSGAMDSLGITDVVILGGSASVTDKVETDLKAKLNGDGHEHVMRIAGAGRYATSAMFAKWATGGMGVRASAGTTASPDMLEALDWHSFGLATGQDFPDALGGGVMCGQSGNGTWPQTGPGHPLLLTPKGTLSESVLDIAGVKPAGSAYLGFSKSGPGYVGYVRRCYVFGGNGTITDSVIGTLDSLIGGDMPGPQ